MYLFFFAESYPALQNLKKIYLYTVAKQQFKLMMISAKHISAACHIFFFEL